MNVEKSKHCHVECSDVGKQLFQRRSGCPLPCFPHYTYCNSTLWRQRYPAVFKLTLCFVTISWNSPKTLIYPLQSKASPRRRRFFTQNNNASGARKGTVSSGEVTSYDTCGAAERNVPSLQGKGTKHRPKHLYRILDHIFTRCLKRVRLL